MKTCLIYFQLFGGIIARAMLVNVKILQGITAPPPCIRATQEVRLGMHSSNI